LLAMGLFLFLELYTHCATKNFHVLQIARHPFFKDYCCQTVTLWKSHTIADTMVFFELGGETYEKNDTTPSHHPEENRSTQPNRK